MCYYLLMKQAIMHISVLEFTCPTCGEHCSNQSGSHLFCVLDLPDEVVCDCCGERLKVPQKAKKFGDT